MLLLAGWIIGILTIVIVLMLDTDNWDDRG